MLNDNKKSLRKNLLLVLLVLIVGTSLQITLAANSYGMTSSNNTDESFDNLNTLVDEQNSYEPMSSYEYTLVEEWESESSINGIDVDENGYVYIAEGDQGLKILDVNDTSNIIELAAMNDGVDAVDVIVRDDIVYLLDNEDGLLIYDTSTIEVPYLVNTYQDDFSNGLALATWEDRLYVVAGYEGLFLYNISDRENPALLSNYSDEGYFLDVEFDGQGFAYIAVREFGLKIIDIRLEDQPLLKGSLQTGNPLSLTYRNHLVYLADEWNGFNVISCFVLENPSLNFNILPDDGSFCAIDIKGINVFIVNDQGYLNSYNITDPVEPLESGYCNIETAVALSIYISEYYVFVGTVNDGLKIITIDQDFDGLVDGNEEEFLMTDPTNADSDDDGLLDGDEHYIYGTDPLDPDSDDDGLLDGEEVIEGINGYITDPLLDDTDGDGLTDGEEVNDHNTNPNKKDTDNDGVNDNIEIANGMNPLQEDTDVDGMDDYYEYLYGLDPLNNDTLQDNDNDTLTNLQEFNLGLNPTLKDTDYDGINDADELYGVYVPENPNANETGFITSNPLLSDSDKDGLIDGDEVFEHLTDPNATDSDNDGLNDYEEVNEGSDGYITNPNKVDTDNDTIPDKWESDYGINPTVDDASDDPDEDELTNLEEYTYKTDPLNADTDDDNMPDGWEIEQGFDPLVKDGANDADGDGLSNWREWSNDCDPHDPDTDGDGLGDKWEVDNGTAPTIADATDDPDNDGLTNLEEMEAGTYPTEADSDQDGLLDGDEVKKYNTNPLKADSDGDGASDKAEVDAGTDPNNSRRNPRKRRIILISVFVTVGVLLLVLIPLTAFFIQRLTNPETKLTKYIQNMKKEGKKSLTIKELSLYTDKKLNKGQVKQVVNDLAIRKENVTLKNNRVWLSSEKELEEKLEDIDEQIAEKPLEAFSEHELSKLEKQIEDIKGFTEKLELSKTTDRSESLQNKIQQMKADLTEQQQIQQEKHDTQAMRTNDELESFDSEETEQSDIEEDQSFESEERNNSIQNEENNESADIEDSNNTFDD
jgi:hypothetical protein